MVESAGHFPLPSGARHAIALIAGRGMYVGSTAREIRSVRAIGEPQLIDSAKPVDVQLVNGPVQVLSLSVTSAEALPSIERLAPDSRCTLSADTTLVICVSGAVRLTVGETVLTMNEGQFCSMNGPTTECFSYLGEGRVLVAKIHHGVNG